MDVNFKRPVDTDFKALINSLKSPDITKKAYDDAINIIDKKVDEIWRYIMESSKRHLEWYAFQNDVSYGHGNGSSGGHFDPVEDAEFITFSGEFAEFSIEHNDQWFEPKQYEYQEGFPTRLLWAEYWKTEVDEHIEKVKVEFLLDRLKQLEKNKENKIAKTTRKKERKQRSKELFNAIKEKVKPPFLTQEEYDFLLINMSNAY